MSCLEYMRSCSIPVSCAFYLHPLESTVKLKWERRSSGKGGLKFRAQGGHLASQPPKSCWCSAWWLPFVKKRPKLIIIFYDWCFGFNGLLYLFPMKSIQKHCLFSLLVYFDIFPIYNLSSKSIVRIIPIPSIQNFNLIIITAWFHDFNIHRLVISCSIF